MSSSARRQDLERLGEEIATLAAHLSAATARWLTMVAEFDEGGGWADGGFKSCAEWLSWRCGVSPGTARDHVRVAQGLRDRPLIADAFGRGELSYSKVRALVRVDDDVDEQLLLNDARAASAGQLERIVRGYRSVAGVEAEAERHWSDREVSWSWDDSGALLLRGRLPAELGCLLVRAIESARDAFGALDGVSAETAARVVSAETAQARERHEAGDPSDPREPVAARNADALIALVQSPLAERASSADVYQVVVHVDADRRCALEDGHPLAPSAARRLMCDASVVEVTEHDGSPLSVGRKTRTIPPALRRALRMRDGGCAFPGCNQRHHTDAHHIEHWADGGETAIDNLVQLCRRHHRLLHEGGFGVRAARDGFVFTKPDGHLIPQAPRQPRGDHAAIVGWNNRRRLRVSAETLRPVDNTGEGFDLGMAVEGLFESRRPRRE